MINVIFWNPQTDKTHRVESFATKQELFEKRITSKANQEQREMQDAVFNGALYITTLPNGGDIYHRTLAELIREYKSKI
ncbi:hypothetical protein ACQ46_gp234 [Citrobacter phage Moon]|uniref:Uncharacterized protein n=2 Tax=Moonvirus TaxID=1985329 RepID=A0A2H4YFZ5_9CAUD|nr:hypothetical protein ACQ46_gp234 [Citrobacter phage Moon]YP_009618284.1 hypothetical protein FDI95_gp235 [Citrobacter phage CF1 ERZ-2017]AIX12190.1 hypothetical protein CPT_Moon219 [Citrobacter phage Moon]AUE23098.1 hypothetical protein Cf1_00235 [Citrobacter phage CF1 ERZ-2017]